MSNALFSLTSRTVCSARNVSHVLTEDPPFLQTGSWKLRIQAIARFSVGHKYVTISMPLITESNVTMMKEDIYHKGCDRQLFYMPLSI
jgi:hypothetical protein